MANRSADAEHDSAGAWAKKYYLATRTVMESVLRPYDLGPTQWYVLYHLAAEGPTAQRDLVRLLHVERATLTGVVAALARKGLVAQSPDARDRRQKTLTLTGAGRALWKRLPDPIALILDTAFTGAADADVATTRRVLQEATARLEALVTKGIS